MNLPTTSGENGGAVKGSSLSGSAQLALAAALIVWILVVILWVMNQQGTKREPGVIKLQGEVSLPKNPKLIPEKDGFKQQRDKDFQNRKGALMSSQSSLRLLEYEMVPAQKPAAQESETRLFNTTDLVRMVSPQALKKISIGGVSIKLEDRDAWVQARADSLFAATMKRYGKSAESLSDNNKETIRKRYLKTAGLEHGIAVRVKALGQKHKYSPAIISEVAEKLLPLAANPKSVTDELIVRRLKSTKS